MKLLSILASATAACALLLACGSTTSVAASGGAPFPVEYSNCASGGSQILPIMGMSATLSKNAQGEVILNTIMTSLFPNEEITSGTYNISVFGSDGNGTSWADQYGAELGSVTELPIMESEGSEIDVPLVCTEGQNDFTFTIYDQNGEQVTCIQFGYHVDTVSRQAKVRKNNNAHLNSMKHIKAPAVATRRSSVPKSARVPHRNHATSVPRRSSALRHQRRRQHQAKKLHA